MSRKLTDEERAERAAAQAAQLAQERAALRRKTNAATRTYRKTKLAALARAGIAYAALRTVNDQSVCDFCRQNRSKVYPLADFPDLPQPNCTDESGCRSYPHPASQGE